MRFDLTLMAVSRSGKQVGKYFRYRDKESFVFVWRSHIIVLSLYHNQNYKQMKITVSMKFKTFYKIGAVISILWVCALLYLGIVILSQKYWWGVFFLIAGIVTGIMDYKEYTYKFAKQ
jgi:hypothetical protein